MSKIEMLFFGSIAAIVLLSWFNAVLRRNRLRRATLRYLVRAAPVAPLGYNRSSSHLAGILIMGFMLLAVALALVKVKEHYTAGNLPSRDPTVLSSLYDNETAQLALPGPPGSDSYSPLDATRKKGVYQLGKEPVESQTPESRLTTEESGNYGIQLAALVNRESAEKLLREVKVRLPNTSVNLGLSQQSGVLRYKVILNLHSDVALVQQSLTDVRRLYPGSFQVNLDQVKLLN